MKKGFVATICILVGLTGCSKGPPPLPPTYPAHGRVTYANGSPVVSGLVQFRSITKSSIWPISPSLA